MSDDPEPEWLLSQWLHLVTDRWAKTGIPRRVRAQLLAQLLRDLAAARAAGARIEELTASAPTVFADSVAAGLIARPVSTARLLISCLGTGTVAAAAAWSFLLLVSGLDITLPASFDLEFTLFVDLFCIAAVLATMVGAARWTYRHHPGAAALTPRIAVTLTLGTLVGFPLASAFGAIQGYRLDSDVITGEALVVLAFLAAAVVAAQRWTTRTGTTRLAAPTSDLRS